MTTVSNPNRNPARDEVTDQKRRRRDIWVWLMRGIGTAFPKLGVVIAGGCRLGRLPAPLLSPTRACRTREARSRPARGFFAEPECSSSAPPLPAPDRSSPRHTPGLLLEARSPRRCRATLPPSTSRRCQPLSPAAAGHQLHGPHRP